MGILSKLRSSPGKIKSIALNYFFSSKNNEHEKKFIRKVNRYKVKWNPGNKNVVLTQVVQDYALAIKLAAAAHHVALQTSSNIGLYSVATKLEDGIFRDQFLWDKLYSEVYYKRLDRIFLSFGGKVIHRNVYSANEQKRINELFINIRNRINRKEDILKIEIEGVRVGDLIYDTYLRFRNKSTLDMNDPFLDKVIRQTLNIYFNCEELFSRYTITALVNTYTTYIHHGVIVRICLKRNIPVYTISSNYSLVHKVAPDFPSHQNNHFHFHHLFEKLEDKNNKINMAAALFEKRFNGEIDAATAYMKESAFTKNYNNELEKLDWSKTVVVLAHCFFDSPHIYRDLLFPDFYEWMTFTLDVLSRQTEMNILVKPHPNGIAGNDQVFEELKKKYAGSNITFIDKKTSNVQLFELRPKAVITAYGTPAPEFAYHKIRVLSIYDNPFTAYKFLNVAESIDQYKELLENIGDLKSEDRKEEILEYYFMQHVFFMKGRENNYLNFDQYKGDTYSDKFLENHLPLMDEHYFKILEAGIKDGFELTEWEQTALQEQGNSIAE